MASEWGGCGGTGWGPSTNRINEYLQGISEFEKCFHVESEVTFGFWEGACYPNAASTRADVLLRVILYSGTCLTTHIPVVALNTLL
jgi:hypothetical protein